MAKKGSAKSRRLGHKAYEKALYDLQVELCRLQAWVKETGERAIVVFEGRDAAGKGGVIKRIAEKVSPRVFRTVALPAPNEREKTQLYVQRYIEHFPAAGEIVLFDRSWYNRAGVERVMGFTEMERVEHFLRTISFFEREVAETGIKLIKYFLHVDQEEQERRFLSRITDPTKHWKLSPMDIESFRRWDEYSIAYDEMLRETHTPDTPWFIIDANDKKRARLNLITHLLAQFDYKPIPFAPTELPPRETIKGAPEDGPRYGTRIPEPY